MKQWNPEDITEFRKAYRLTRKALGERLGVDALSVYRWEKDMRTPSRTVEILLSMIEKELKRKRKA